MTIVNVKNIIGYWDKDVKATRQNVNHPHLIGVGMSREGYGQQVDKEA